MEQSSASSAGRVIGPERLVIQSSVAIAALWSRESFASLTSFVFSLFVHLVQTYLHGASEQSKSNAAHHKLNDPFPSFGSNCLLFGGASVSGCVDALRHRENKCSNCKEQ